MKNSLFLFVNIITSLTSLFYFLFITREASILTGEETLFQSLCLGLYLLFMGVGSSRYKAENSKSEALIKVIKLDLSVLITGALSPVILYWSLATYIALNYSAPVSPQDVPLYFVMFFSLTSVSLLGFFTGGQLPLFISYKSEDTNMILFMNYLGALIAGPFINELLHLESSSKNLLLTILFINLFTPISLYFLTYAKKSLMALSLAVTVFTTIFYSYDNIERNFLTAYYHGVKVKDITKTGTLFKNLKSIGEITRINTPYQRIDIVRENPQRNQAFAGNMTIYLNHKPQFDLTSHKTYHESMVHGALNLSNIKPKEILILGGGDGLLLNELYKSGYENVTLIELDQQMLDLSRNHFTLSYINQGILENKKESNIKIIKDDGFFHIRSQIKKYDAIFIDFPYPYSDEIINLYSKEFYEVVNKRLKNNGFFVLDFPITDKDSTKAGKLAHKLRKTLLKAGINNSYSFGPYSSFIFAQKNDLPIEFQYDKLPKNLSLSTYLNLVGLEHLFTDIETYRAFSLFYGE